MLLLIDLNELFRIFYSHRSHIRLFRFLFILLSHSHIYIHALHRRGLASFDSNRLISARLL